jgi:hypothetical protein
MSVRRCQRLDDFKSHQRFVLDDEDDTSTKSLIFHNDSQPDCSTPERLRLVNSMEQR